jgi:hypothetical protein
MSAPFKSKTLVSLERFFEGNTGLGSIGCNLIDHPGIERFYAVLKSIRAHSDVQDVLVYVRENQEETGMDWAFSDVAYILTSADMNSIEKLLEELEPDPLSEGWSDEEIIGKPNLDPGMKVICVWWD